MAINGQKILEFEANDLAMAGAVSERVSARLSLVQSRIKLLYRGCCLRYGDPLYKIGAFQRNLTFQAIIVPPLRCRVCSYAYCVGRVIPPGKLVPGSADLDYNFILEQDEDKDSFERLDPDTLRELDLEFSSLGDAKVATACYCAAIASEFGWKCRRFWSRMVRNVRKLRNASDCASGAPGASSDDGRAAAAAAPAMAPATAASGSGSQIEVMAPSAFVFDAVSKTAFTVGYDTPMSNASTFLPHYDTLCQDHDGSPDDTPMSRASTLLPNHDALRQSRTGSPDECSGSLDGSADDYSGSLDGSAGERRSDELVDGSCRPKSSSS